MPEDRARVLAHYRELAPEYSRRANKTCEETYLRLIRRFLGGRQRVLELGAGSSDLLPRLGSLSAVACDLSVDMLRARPPGRGIICVVAAAERLPFLEARFDGVFLINLLEHVSDLDAVVYESARVLEPGGVWLAVTPNGKWERLLDLAERWSLKIPEGPHDFLTPARLRLVAGKALEVVEHRTFLALPAGPPAFASLVDRLAFCSALGWGFFQYLVARKPF